MSKFRKSKQREVPSLNTASLPDLIFTLLFFFMIVTNMREAPHRLQFRIPNATELQKLEKQSLVTYVLVNKEGNIQVDNRLISMEELPGYFQQVKAGLSQENRDKMTVSLKIDKNTKMGLVNDIKQILRESDILMVHFAAEKKQGK